MVAIELEIDSGVRCLRFSLRYALQHVLFGNLGYVCLPSEGPSPSGLYRSPSVRERERERESARESV